MKFIHGPYIKAIFLLGLILAMTNCAERYGKAKPLGVENAVSTNELSKTALESWPRTREVFKTYCVECHLNNTKPDFSILDNVIEKIPKIKDFISSGYMPFPGPEADKITQEERDIILNWIKTATTTETVTGKKIEETPLIRAERNLKNCMGCHGENGKSSMDGVPHLGGLLPNYITNQIENFKNGNRKDLMMSPQVKGLTKYDIEFLSINLSRLNANNKEVTTPAKEKASETSDSDTTNPETSDSKNSEDSNDEVEKALEEKKSKMSVEELALFIHGEEVVTKFSCTGCHVNNNPNVESIFPSLNGQKSSYIVKQINDFLSDRRNSDLAVGKGMKSYIKNIKLNEDDIKAVGFYFETL